MENTEYSTQPRVVFQGFVCSGNLAKRWLFLYQSRSDALESRFTDPGVNSPFKAHRRNLPSTVAMKKKHDALLIWNMISTKGHNVKFFSLTVTPVITCVVMTGGSSSLWREEESLWLGSQLQQRAFRTWRLSRLSRLWDGLHHCLSSRCRTGPHRTCRWP